LQPSTSCRTRHEQAPPFGGACCVAACLDRLFPCLCGPLPVRVRTRNGGRHRQLAPAAAPSAQRGAGGGAAPGRIAAGPGTKTPAHGGVFIVAVTWCRPRAGAQERTRPSTVLPAST